ncbi:MAG TPA: cation:proton antiporter, partial [Limnochordia bacterium]|nr:cation:proton antiporter [Limnochordia bacterium]
MENEIWLNHVLLISALAFATPLITTRLPGLSIPVVVGEILVGLAFGRSGLGWIGTDPIVDFVVTMGLAFLMFLSGLEIDFEMLSRAWLNRKQPDQPHVALPVLAFAASSVLALGLAWLLIHAGLGQNLAMMTLILSTTSLGVVLPTLKETAIARTAFGQRVLILALVADLLTMLAITVVVALQAEGPKLETLLILFLFVVFWLIQQLGRRLVRWRHFQEQIESHAEIGVRGAFMLIFLFAFLAIKLGSELILGAFLAGAIVSLTDKRERSTLRGKLEAFGFGFFIPAFFIATGANLDLGTLHLSWPLVGLFAALLVGLYAVKIVPLQLYRRYFNTRELLSAGVLLSARLSLLIAAARIGLNLGLITPRMHTILLLMAVVTSAVSPILFKRWAPRPERARDAVFLLGAQAELLLLQKRLKGHGVDAECYETDPPQIETARRSGAQVQPIAPERLPELYGRVRAAGGKLIIHPGEPLAAARAAMAAHEAGVPSVVVVNPDPQAVNDLVERGVQVVTPTLSMAVMLESLSLFPDL